MRKPARARAVDPAASQKAGGHHVDDVEDLLRAVNDNVDRIWLWRRSTGNWDYLDSVSPVALRDLGIRETVRQRFGGGQFKARMRANNGKWGPSREFSIEGAAKARDEQTSSAAGAGAGAPPLSQLPQLPPWVSSLVLPVLTAIGTGVAAVIVKRLTETPKAAQTDPVVVELLKRIGRAGERGESLNPLELQRLLLDAETRGEHRGREVGELAARANGEGSSGVGSAIREALPMFNRLVDIHAAERLGPSSSAGGDDTSLPRADIVPAWLRPYMSYRSFLVHAADNRHAPAAIAGIVINSSSDELWLEIVNADAAGRLESDLLAAMPELTETAERRQFAAGIVEELRKEMRDDDAGAAAHG